MAPINQFSKILESQNPSSEPEVEQDETFDVELEDDYGESGNYSSEGSKFDVGSHYENLTYLFNEDDLKKLGSEICDAVRKDEESRKGWIENAKLGLKLLGLSLGKGESSVVQGGCTATLPLILETAVKFQSKIRQELLPADGPVKVKVVGKRTEPKLLQANRVGMFMNYQLTQEIEEFYPETEKMSLYSSIFGSGFKKNSYDPDEKRPVNEFVQASNFIVPMYAQSIKKAERYTHQYAISERGLDNRILSGYYSKPEEVELVSGPCEEDDFTKEWNEIIGLTQATTDYGYVLYEHYCYKNFEEVDELRSESGRTKPYVITVEKSSGTVLSIRRNWKEGDNLVAARCENFTHYPFIIGFGFYGLGLIHLLGNTQASLTTMLRSLVDAGQFMNLQGGYKMKGARILNDSSGFAMGEFKDVEGIANMDLRQVFLPHQFKEPSQVLFALLQFLDKKGSDFADATDQILQNSVSYGPVGTTMALIEAAQKLYGSIYSRYHKSLGTELKIIADLNYTFGPEDYPFSVPGGEDVFRTDFDPNVIDVIPVSDPNISSQAHRVALANAKLEGALKARQADPKSPIDLKPIIRDFFMNLDPQMDVEKMFVPEEEVKPLGPVEDLMQVIGGKPIKAFKGQDHQSHITVKQSWLGDPTQGASKTMQEFQPIVLANIREHLIMAYQESLEGMVQVTGAATDEKTNEMVIAQAAQQLAQINAQMVESGSPEQKVAEAVMLEAQTKAKEQNFKERMGVADYALKAAEVLTRQQAQINRAAEVASKADQALLQRQSEALGKFTDSLLKNKALDIQQSKANQERRSRGRPRKQKE